MPVAHCELNPIELAWANVKEYIRKHNKQFTMSEIEILTPIGIRKSSGRNSFSITKKLRMITGKKMA